MTKQGIEASLVFDRETKGAVRFVEVDSKGSPVEVTEATVGTIYLRKTALNGEVPKRLKVSLSW